MMIQCANSYLLTMQGSQQRTLSPYAVYNKNKNKLILVSWNLCIFATKSFLSYERERFAD